MRFVIAATFLAQALPSQSQSNGLVEVQGRRKEFVRSMTESRPIDRAGTIKQAIRKRRRLGIGRGLLRNSSIQRAIPTKECNPDIGLLACGLGEFCHASQDSELGGTCMPIRDALHRQLQESGSPTSAPVASTTDSPTSALTNSTIAESGPTLYCDPSSSSYGELQCDCSGWSVEELAGTFQCTVLEEKCYPGCDDTCYSLDFTYTVDGSDISYQYCYEFITPLQQRFCFGSNNDQTCLFSLDGEMCSSCYTTYRLNCNYGPCYSQPCSNFDCTNIDLGTGSTCDDSPVPPAFNDCYLQIGGLYPSCSVCPQGVVTYPEAIIDLPGYGSFNCSYLGAVALNGALNPQECTYATILASNACCEGDDEDVFVCNLCKDESHVITNGDASVNIPSQPSVSCTNLQTVASQGAIDASQCGIVQGFTDQACACRHPDDIAPTASPVAMPISADEATDADADAAESISGSSICFLSTFSSALVLSVTIWSGL